MNIISLMVVLVVVGLLLWLVNNYIPMEARIKQILNIVVVIMVVLWVLNAVGVMGMLPAPTDFGAGDPGRRRSAVVAGQQLHTDGGAHQADIEYRGDYPGGSVAAECIRGFERTPACSRRQSVVLLALKNPPDQEVGV